MFLGHFGVAFAAKKAAPKTSLGTLVFAAQFADLLWPILLLLGVEQRAHRAGPSPRLAIRFHVVPDFTQPCRSVGMGSAAGSHLFCDKARWQERVAGRRPCAHALGARFHRAPARHADLSRRREIRTRNVEFHSVDDFSGVRSVCGGHRALHQRDSRERFGTGNLALWSLVGLLGVLYPASLFGPPPPSVQALAWSAIAIWLTVPWAAWADRHRQSDPDKSETPSH